MNGDLNTAIFPGSFYPFTIGHLDILRQALKIFDRVIIVYGKNSDKNYNDPSLNYIVDEQQKKLKERFGWSIDVINYDGLNADLCDKYHASFIIRGIRNSIDFEYEKNLAEANKLINSNINTIFFIPSDPKLNVISSSFVRELMTRNKDITEYIL